MRSWTRVVQLCALLLLTAAALALVVAAVTRSYPTNSAAEDRPDPAPTGERTDGTASPERPEPTGTPSPGPATMQRAQRVLLAERPLDVLVLGDSSSNGPFEWPAEWGRRLTDDRTVTIRLWDEQAERFAVEPIRPPSSGLPFTIWSLSQPDVAAAYGTQHLGTMPTDPELVLLNYGHFNTPDDIGPQLDALLSAIEQRWPAAPVAVILQNPTLDPRSPEHATTVAFVRHVWAPRHSVPVIDVESAFRLAGPLPSLLQDGTNPNETGTEVWVDEVTRALTPGAAETDAPDAS